MSRRRYPRTITIDGHLSHPQSNFPAVLNDKGDLGFARVTTNQHGVTLAFDKYDELPVVKNERTGALGRRGTVVTDVCLDPADNNWILLNTKDVIVPLNPAIQTTKDLKLREVSPASEWKDIEHRPPPRADRFDLF